MVIRRKIATTKKRVPIFHGLSHLLSFSPFYLVLHVDVDVYLYITYERIFSTAEGFFSGLGVFKNYVTLKFPFLPP